MKYLEIELALTNLRNEKDYFITLPTSEEDLKEFINKVSNNKRDGYIISDVLESDIYGLEICSYDNVYELNDFMNYINELEEYDQDILLSLFECGGVSCLSDTEHINLDEYILEYDINDYYEAGYYFYENNYGIVDDVIKDYFDFEKYGRDMIDGYIVSKGFLIYVA